MAAYELGMALIWRVDLANNGMKKKKREEEEGTNLLTTSKAYLEEAKDLLAKAVDILSYEAPGTNHGLLGQAAKNELAKL